MKECNTSSTSFKSDVNCRTEVKKQDQTVPNNCKNKVNMYSAIKFISQSLTNIIISNMDDSANFRLIKQQQSNCFYNKIVPNISIENYLIRLVSKTKIQVSTLIVMSIYIDNFCERNDTIITPYNALKIVFAAFIVAIKYNEEIVYSDYYYSRIGLISISELILIESIFLDGINFKLYIKDEDFSTAYYYLKSTINYMSFTDEKDCLFKKALESTAN